MTVLETDLEMAERHVREGALQVAHQIALIDDLRARGQPTELAEELLSNFVDIQRMHQAHLDRLVAF